MKGYNKIRIALLGTALVATAKTLATVDEIKNSEHYKRAVDAVDDIIAKVKKPEVQEPSVPPRKGTFDETLDTVLDNLEALARRDAEKRAMEEVQYESVFSFLTHRARYMSNPELREYLNRALNLEINAEAAELIRHFVHRAGVQYTNVWETEDEIGHKTMGDFFRSMVGSDIERDMLLNLVYRHMNHHQTTFFISNFDLDNISSGFASRGDIDTLIAEHGFDKYSFVPATEDEKNNGYV